MNTPIHPSSTIAIDRETSHVFKRYAIDTQSNLPLSQLSPASDFISQVVDSYMDLTSADANDYTRYDIDTLVDFLERSHAYYLNKRMPEIRQTILALSRELPADSFLIMALFDFHKEYIEDMEQHFKMEENKLFPYALDLSSAMSGTDAIALIKQAMRTYSVDQFSAHHDHDTHELDDMLTLLGQFEPLYRKCMPFNILVNQLNSFKLDLQMHELIEEDVLVGKLRAIEMAIA